MAPRAKSKKKAAPIANGATEANNSPSITVKKPVRGRKAAAVEEKNAEIATSNGNAEPAISVETKPAPRDAPAANTARPSKNNPKKAKQAATKSTVAAAKKNEFVEVSSDQNADNAVAPTNPGEAGEKAGKKVAVKYNDVVEASSEHKGNGKASKKAAEPKVVSKPATKAVEKDNGQVDEQSVVPAIPAKSSGKAAKKVAQPKEVAAKPKTKAALKDNGEVEATAEQAPVPVASGKVSGKAAKKVVEPKVAAKPAPRAEKKSKSAEVSAPQPTDVIVASAEIVTTASPKGRKKREHAKPIEAIAESSKPKRGKKQTPVAPVVQEKIDVKVKAAPKRTAFSKKSKNVSEENGSTGDEVIPVEPVAAKRAKAQPKPVPAKPAVVVEKRTINKRKAAEKPPVREVSEAEEEEEEEVAPKRSRKKIPVAEAKTKATKAADADKPKMNATETEFAKINFTSDKDFNMKICSFNVAGLRAFVKKGGHEYFNHEQPNIICLQEIKCMPDEVPEEAKLANYHPYWFSKPGGHGGVAILSKNLAHHVEYGLGDEEMDNEGRIITAEYEKFYLICVYVPNAGRKLVTLPRRLRWNKMFEAHVTKLDQLKPVIICGDMNVAHTEIDLTNPKTNAKNAGFTPEEREGMTDLLALGFTDAFRYLYPSVQKAYTFWSYMGNARSKNVGWRLDYFITSNRLNPTFVDCFMRPEVMGSDHCPINLLLNI